MLSRRRVGRVRAGVRRPEKTTFYKRQTRRPNETVTAADPMVAVLPPENVPRGFLIRVPAVVYRPRPFLKTYSSWAVTNRTEKRCHVRPLRRVVVVAVRARNKGAKNYWRRVEARATFEVAPPTLVAWYS